MGREREAAAALRIAYDDLMKQADSIRSEEDRSIYLANFPLHRDIVSAWAEISEVTLSSEEEGAK